MSNVGAHQLWVTGSRAYFQRDPIATVVQPLIDLGPIKTLNPTFNPTKIECKDGDGGFLQRIDTKVIEASESYEINTKDCGPETMALLFQSKPEALTQAATVRTDVKHYAVADELLKVLDDDYDADDPKFAQGITSIGAVTSAAGGGGTTYVADDDYEVVSLERGIIRMLSTGTNTFSDGNVFITYTPRAITGNRKIVVGSSLTTIKGKLALIWSMENHARQVIRACYATISPQGSNIQIEDYSDITLLAEVLYDLSSDEPAGTLEYWLGALPDVS